MITCKKCGRSNEDHYRFCLGCGARLADQKEAPKPAEPIKAAEPAKPIERICSNCGSIVPENFTFCGKCGTRYVAPEPVVATPPPIPVEPEGPKLLAVLVSIKPDGSEGERFEMTAGDFKIGRDNPEPFAGDPFLSPTHARFSVSDGGDVVVEDLDSINGVFIRVADEVELSHGSQIRIGQELLLYHTLDKQEPILSTQDDTRVYGAGTVGAWGRVERIVAPGVASHAYLLDKPEVLIGREAGDITFSDDGFVSGRHAQILHSAGTSTLKDLNSSNGTYIRLTAPRKLRTGDLLLLGQQVVRLSAP
ncbi:MAG: FHA domain-containing protein [Myxococcota bacterium]